MAWFNTNCDNDSWLGYPMTDHWYDQLFLISHDVTFTEITDQLIDLRNTDRRTIDS